MRYRVNTSCAECGRRYSYWSDDASELKHCPNDPPTPTERELVAMPAHELERRLRRGV